MAHKRLYGGDIATNTALVKIGEIFCCRLPVLIKSAIYNRVRAVTVEKYSVFIRPVIKLGVFHSENFFPRCFEAIFNLNLRTYSFPQQNSTIVDNGIICRRDFFIKPLLGVNIFENFYLRKFHAVISFCKCECVEDAANIIKLLRGCFLAVNLVYYFNILYTCCRSCCESHFAGGLGIIFPLDSFLAVNKHTQDSYSRLKYFVFCGSAVCVVSALAFQRKIVYAFVSCSTAGCRSTSRKHTRYISLNTDKTIIDTVVCAVPTQHIITCQQIHFISKAEQMRSVAADIRAFYLFWEIMLWQVNNRYQPPHIVVCYRKQNICAAQIAAPQFLDLPRRVHL